MEVNQTEKNTLEIERGNTTREHALRTYSSDVAKALKQNQGSVIKIAMAEEKKRRESLQGFNEQKESKKWLVWIFVFLLLGAITLLSVWYINRPKEVVIETKTGLQNSEIFVEREKIFLLEGGRSTIIQNIDQAKKEMQSQNNQMMNIYMLLGANTSNKKATFDDLMSYLGNDTPKAFSVSTVKDFMLGIENREGVVSPFFILKADSFEELFPGMINWENEIVLDTYEIFGIEEYLINDLSERSWQDKLVNNKDMRYLYDETGSVVLVYGYAEPETIVLAESQETFDRVLGRLQDRAK